MTTCQACSHRDRLRRTLLERARLNLRHAEHLFRDVLDGDASTLPMAEKELTRLEHAGLGEVGV